MNRDTYGARDVPSPGSKALPDAPADHRPSGYDPSRVWHWSDDLPRPMSRVVVLYNDGSGAFTGMWTGHEFIDADGEDGGWRDEPGTLWAYLPAGFALWCEVRSQDPLTFPRDSDTHPEGGDGEAAPFMGSAGRQASPDPSIASKGKDRNGGEG